MNTPQKVEHPPRPRAHDSVLLVFRLTQGLRDAVGECAEYQEITISEFARRAMELAIEVSRE